MSLHHLTQGGWELGCVTLYVCGVWGGEACTAIHHQYRRGVESIAFCPGYTVRSQQGIHYACITLHTDGERVLTLKNICLL
jgi:hypothetical protein